MHTAKGYALITGASKGIGKAFALQLAGMGYGLLLVSRSEEELIAITSQIKLMYDTPAHYMAIDLTDYGAEEKVLDWHTSLRVPLVILINNAGYGLWGNFESLPLSAQLNMLQLNINTVVELSHLFLPVLKKQSQAYILNIASTAAYQAMPTLAIYAASKTFVLTFSRAINYELKGSGVSVSCLCPGPTATNFANRAGMAALAELAEKFNMQADEVAKAGLQGMFRKKAEIIPGTLNRVSAFATRLIPKALIEYATARLYK